MAKMSFKEKAIIEDLFGMESGYVIDFSNSTFERFVGESINIDIYNGIGYTEYCSKANKLRKICNRENDSVVGKLLKDLVEHFEIWKENTSEDLSEDEQSKLGEAKIIAQRLLGNTIELNLPKKQEETFQTLMEDINDSLAKNKPELALDRLHTFSTKLLRKICEGHKIDVLDNKGEFLALHSLAGKLKNYYQQNNPFETDFTISALQTSINLFDKYNEIRNNKSYAHDNKILGKIEAEFAVKAMANVIIFIDNIESYLKKVEADKQRQKMSNIFDFDDIDDEDLPF